jgi:hypothetical protein
MQEIKLVTILRCVAKPRHSDSALKELGDQVSTFCGGNDCTVQTLARHMRHTLMSARRDRRPSSHCEDTIDAQCHAMPRDPSTFPIYRL